MKNIIIYFFFLFVLSSCAAQNEYSAIISAINEIKTPFQLKSIDTIEIVDYSFKISEALFNGYKVQKEIALNNKIPSSGSNWEWIDGEHAWILTDDDIEYMVNSLKTQKKQLWEIQNFNDSKKIIKVIDFPFFEKSNSQGEEMKKRLKTDKFVYFFSIPLFNKIEDIFIIQYEIILFPFSTTTLIFKKENGSWKKVGGIYPTGE